MFATIFWSIAALISVFACAVSVGSCLRSSRVRDEILSRSLSFDGIEGRVDSAEKAIRRIEGRQTARMRPEVPPPPLLMDKEQLRTYAGLRPGKAVKEFTRVPDPSDSA